MAFLKWIRQEKRGNAYNIVDPALVPEVSRYDRVPPAALAADAGGCGDIGEFPVHISGATVDVTSVNLTCRSGYHC